MIRQILIGLIAASSVGGAPSSDLPEAKVTVRVVDENSRPISGIEVAVTFEMPKYRPGVWGSSEMITKRGSSNAEGLFSATAKSGNYVGYGAEAIGFYPSIGKPVEFARSEDGRWQPWDPTVVLILKQVIRPIPMYVRRLEREIPVLKPVGFDLIEGDWITPHGRGKSGDILFKLTKRVTSFDDFGAELLLSFPNNGDGITLMSADNQGGSALRSSHEAPGGGYDPSLLLLQGNSKDRGRYGMTGEDKNYFFRVRTILDERGQVVSCLYGKIYGRIEYFPVSYKTAKVRFTYYLNPTPNDRNVEFDPKRNLFTNLKSDERVTAP